MKISKQKLIAKKICNQLIEDDKECISCHKLLPKNNALKHYCDFTCFVNGEVPKIKLKGKYKTKMYFSQLAKVLDKERTDDYKKYDKAKNTQHKH